MKREVIIACDFSDKDELFDFLSVFKNESLFLKIGMELFYLFGPEIIREIKKNNVKIFLDLKLHDIPNTVFRTILNLVKLEVDFISMHACAGKEAIKRAKEAVLGTSTKILAVTLLTSISSEILKNEILIDRDINDVILNYAINSYLCKIDGVICSVNEVKKIKKSLGNNFLCVTPGIRYSISKKFDQLRVSTPLNAKKEGSDFIVVGRLITMSKDPLSIYNKIKEEFV